MKLEMTGQRIEVTEALFAHLERRPQFALDRFCERVPRVSVTVADLNGPRGGVDKRCHIIAHSAPRGTVIVDVIDAEMFFAIDRAVDRLGRAVPRELERRRERAVRVHELKRISAASLFRQALRARRGQGGMR